MKSLRYLLLLLVMMFTVQQSLFAENAKEQLVYRSVQKAAWFPDHNRRAHHVAYVVMEPNCYYCKLLFKELEPYLHSEQLSVRWVIGAFLGRTSQAKGAAILQSADPYAALLLNETQYSKDSGEGGIEEAAHINADSLNKLERNNRFLSRYGFGTPVLIYRDKDHRVHVLEGLLSTSALEKAINEMDSTY